MHTSSCLVSLVFWLIPVWVFVVGPTWQHWLLFRHLKCHFCVTLGSPWETAVLEWRFPLPMKSRSFFCERKDMWKTHLSEVRWNLHHAWDLFSYVLYVQFVGLGLAGCCCCCCCCCCSVTVVPFNCGIFQSFPHILIKWLQVYRWQVVCWWQKNAGTACWGHRCTHAHTRLDLRI